jgi:hypothetical protein
VTRIVTLRRRGELPELPDAVAYEAGAAWAASDDGEAMLALLSEYDPARTLVALRACAAARQRMVAGEEQPRSADEAVAQAGAPARFEDMDAYRAAVRRIWADAVRAIQPTAPPLQVLYRDTA